MNGAEFNEKKSLSYLCKYRPELYRIFENIAESFQVPTDIVAIVYFVIVGSVIGAFYKVKVKEEYYVNNNFFMFLVGVSGSGKTPVVSYLMKQILALESLHPDTQLYINRATPEATIDLLKKAIQGLLMYRDELLGLKTEGNYSRDSTAIQSLLNEGYEGKEYKRSTLSGGNKVVPSMLLTILGTTTPGTLKSVFNKSDFYSGLIQRFDFLYLEDAIKPFTSIEIQPENTTTLFEIMSKIFENRAQELTYVELDKDAHDLWKSWFLLIETSRYYNIYGIEHFQGYLSKHKNSAVKFASILWHIDNATGHLTKKITIQQMETAIEIADTMREQTTRAWEFFLLKKEAVYADNLEKLLISVLNFMIDQNKKTKFLCGEICDVLNDHVKRKYPNAAIQYEPSAVGRVLIKMGFESARSSRGSVYCIDQALLYEMTQNV